MIMLEYDTGSNYKDGGIMSNNKEKRLEYSNGRYYMGELQDGQPEGHGAFYFSGGHYEGEFSQGTYNGFGTMCFDSEQNFSFDNREYDIRDMFMGNWVDGKKDGRFIHMYGGVPYDVEFRMGDSVTSKIYYDLPAGEELRGDRTIKCWYGGQSCFIIETANETLVFDWYRSSMPPLNPNKPVYIFVTHVHGDHFDKRIFSLTEKYNVPEIYIGYKRSHPETLGFFDDLSPEIEDLVSFFNGEQFLLTDYGSIKSLRSTDLGVAFLVTVGDYVFFHAGDLFCRSAVTFNDYKKILKDQLPKDYDGNLDKAARAKFSYMVDNTEAVFKEYASPLRGLKIDYAMLPLDPRWDDFGMITINHYLNISTIKHFSPMHMWEKYDFVSDYINRFPQHKDIMISVNPDKLAIEQSIELNKPYYVRL